MTFIHNFQDITKHDVALAAKTRAQTEHVGPEGNRVARKFAQEMSKRIFRHDRYSKFISLHEANVFLFYHQLPDETELKKRLNGFLFGEKGIAFIPLEKYAQRQGYAIKKIAVEGDDS